MKKELLIIIIINFTRNKIQQTKTFSPNRNAKIDSKESKINNYIVIKFEN